ncbi:MAG TPA: homocysteine S-methyltransferase family protein [Syntrophomonadaceae bacterium]|nr:homocysteine S-methyltransferase family protein [Syntrophomonadaceae bacterium]
MDDLSLILKSKTLILDGAMGTMLQKSGMLPGECPEVYGIDNPKILENIHYEYIEAGADIIQTNTFGANALKLDEYGFGDMVSEINTEAINIAKRVADGKAFVAVSIGPTGKLLKPFGDADYDQLFNTFSEQMIASEKAGADLISIETMTDIGEMRVALAAAKHCTKLPVIAHMTFEDGGRTMMGTDPLTALLILEAFQPLAIGANCSGGARELLPIIAELNRYTSVYLTVEPNAGIPALIDGQTVFPDTPEQMAEYGLLLKDAGANIIGGCCGTTPAHIKAMADALRGLSPAKKNNSVIRGFASRTNTVLIGQDKPLAILGERINPTARKQLAKEIRSGQMQMVIDEAKNQVLHGAAMLDVNMGVPGIDEKETMEMAVLAIQNAIDVPIAIDSTNIDAVEAGLKAFVGRPLINSTTAEDKDLELILPLAKKYGAAILGLCIDEKGIPNTAGERVDVARKIYKQAKEHGLRDEDIYIDSLVKTASAEQSQVMEAIKALQMIKNDFNVGTVLGVSNVSHGLPGREILNSTYLAMAWAAGLDLPIINPLDKRLMDTTKAAAVLLNRDDNCLSFIDYYKDFDNENQLVTQLRSPICLECNIPEIANQANGGALEKEESPDNLSIANTALGIEGQIQQAVFQGNQELTLKLIEEALAQDIEPLDIVNTSLIPGIEEAGIMYDKKRYFLPQLMIAANAMNVGFAKIKPLLSEESSYNQGVIVLATVEGDIHDIGKNIVAVLLENYGFKVIDLGKDVRADDIIESAISNNADIIGLSALMTTTMPRMQEVVEKVKARALDCKIMVGGAVLTPEYAQDIGADAYSSDARNAVIEAKKLLQK